MRGTERRGKALTLTLRRMLTDEKASLDLSPHTRSFFFFFSVRLVIEHRATCIC